MNKSQMPPMLIVIMVAFLGLAAYYGLSLLMLAVAPTDIVRLIVGALGLLLYFVVGYVVSSRVPSAHLTWAAVAGLTTGVLVSLLSLAHYLLFQSEVLGAAVLVPRLLSIVVGVGLAVLGGWIAARSSNLRAQGAVTGTR